MAQRDSTGLTIYQTNQGGHIAFAHSASPTLPTDAGKFAQGCILVMPNSKAYSNQAPALSNASFVLMNAAMAGVSPAYQIFAAGKHTTVGGASSEDQAATGVVAGDIAFASLIQKGATPRTILTAITATDKLTFTFSGDPSTDHVVAWQVLRAVS